MRTTATAAHLDAILDDIGTVVIEGAAAFAILRTDATDLHGRHLLQQRWTQMLVVAKQLRELYTALLQIHIQMAAKRGNQRLDFSAKVSTPLTWRKTKIRGGCTYSTHCCRRVLSLARETSAYCLLVVDT